MKATLIIFCATTFLFAQALVNEKVSRKIDLTTNIVRVTAEVTLRNDGDAAETHFEVIFPPKSQLADLEVQAGKGKNLPYVRAKSSDKGDRFTVTLSPALPKGETAKVTIFSTHTHQLQPFPAEITQSENQYVVFTGSRYWYSPYKTESQTTDVTLPSSAIESYTKDDAVARGSSISYGPFKNVGPYSESELRVHYSNNHPFMTLTTVVKEVEVSHWGHVSVEEHVDVAHTGARLKGGFSRLDFQRNPTGTPSHFRAMVARLPASAYSLYYRDVIGNISTSRAHVHRPEGQTPFTKLELFARYLLLGGWKTKFYYGYAAPLGEFLGIAQDGAYTLAVPFGTAIQGAVVDTLTTRIILPEGATDIRVSGIDGLSEQRSLRQTYLDTTGRPVVAVTKHNVVGDNDRLLLVTYRYAAASLWFDVALVVLGFFVIFAAFIVSGRFFLTIGKEGRETVLAKETAQELSLRLHNLDQRLQAAIEADDDAQIKAHSRAVAELKATVLQYDGGLGVRYGLLEAAVTELGRGRRDAKALAEYSTRLAELDADITSKL